MLHVPSLVHVYTHTLTESYRQPLIMLCPFLFLFGLLTYCHILYYCIHKFLFPQPRYNNSTTCTYLLMKFILLRTKRYNNSNKIIIFYSSNTSKFLRITFFVDEKLLENLIIAVIKTIIVFLLKTYTILIKLIAITIILSYI